MRVSGRQEVTEAHMQNESCPRRARRRKAHRRGSQQAGRIGRAKGKRRRSFCGLAKSRALGSIKPIHHFLIGANVETQTGLDARKELAIADRSHADCRKTRLSGLGVSAGAFDQAIPNVVFCDDVTILHVAIFGIHPELSRDASRWT